MERKNKILLTLSDSELQRLNQLKTSFQKSSAKRVTSSDILRRSLFALPFQGALL